MRLPDEERTAEISESLRVSGEAEIRWIRLVSKFRARLHIPAFAIAVEPVRQPMMEPPPAK